MSFLTKDSIILQNFDEHKKKISNKSFVLQVQDLLKKNVNTSASVMDARNLLITYTIVGYPSVIMEKPYSEKDLKLQELASQLVLMFENNFDMMSFSIYFEKFTKYFAEWKDADLIKIITPHVMSYYQFVEMLKVVETDNDNSVVIWRGEVENMCKKIKNDLLKMGGRKAVEYLENYKPPQVTLDNAIYKQIEQSVKKSFWVQFSTDIENKNYSQIPGMLEDVRRMIFELIPNRNDKHEEFDLEVDFLLLKQMIDNNAINTEDIYKIMMSTLEYIKKLQSFEDDIPMEEFIQTLTDWFTKGDKLYSFIFTEYFKNVFTKLEKIKDDCEEVHRQVAKKEVELK